MALVLPFTAVTRRDVASVGGKNSSLGELIQNLTSHGVAVPPGFATTASAYWRYVRENEIDAKIDALIKEWQAGKASLSDTGQAVRTLFLRGDWPVELAEAI